MGSSSGKQKNPVMNQATTDPDNPPHYKKLKDRSYPAKFKALAAKHHTDLKPGNYQESPQAVYEGNKVGFRNFNEFIRKNLGLSDYNFNILP